MTHRNYYDVLEISRTATDDEIRKAYKVMVRKYHPDLNAGDAQAAERFKQVTEAYGVLSDKKKRSMYDYYNGPPPQGYN